MSGNRRYSGISFGTKEAKEAYVLRGILLNIEYLGKQYKLSSGDKEVLKLTKRDLKTLIKKKEGSKKVTHYAMVDRANESDNTDYWSDPICGTYSENGNLESDWKYVTCKKCLKTKDKYEAEIKIAIEKESEYYKGFVEHLKKEEK